MPKKHTIVACVGISLNQTHDLNISRRHNSLAAAMTWASIDSFCISFSSLQPLLFATYLILGCVLKQAIQMSESATSNYLVYNLVIP